MTPARSLERLGLPPAIPARWRVQLGEPHRHYHTFAHVAAMLDHLADEDATPELIAAIWLHDIVYDPHASDNEARSAEQALRNLAGTPIDAREVAALIAGTQRHAPGSPVQNLLNDLDLGILGADAAGYARYAEQIRAEYAFVPLDVYAPARAKLLRAFDQRRIYQTPRFAPREAQAHRNLAHEIAALEGMT